MAIFDNILDGVGGSLVSGIFGTLQAANNREYNERMWHMNNEYNSPVQQVARARDAGINPNALFSNGYSPVSSSNLTASAETNALSNSTNLLGSLTTQMLALAQAENINVDTGQKKFDLTFSKMTMDERYKCLVGMNRRQDAEIKKIFSDIGMNEFSKDLQTKTYAWFSRKSETEIKVMTEQLNLLRNQSLDILKSIDVKDSTIKDIFASVRLKDRQTEFYDTQTVGVEADVRLKDKQADYTHEQTTGQVIANDIQDVVRQFSNATGIPIGAKESEALFMLWKEGKFEDFVSRLSVIAVENGSRQFLPKTQDLINDIISSAFKSPYSLLKAIFTK